MPGTPTTRYQLDLMAGTDQGSTIDDTHNAAMTKLDGFLSPVYSGTLAARPAAGKLGRHYYATDRGMLYFDTGSAWIAMFPEIGTVEWVGKASYTGGYKDGWVVANGQAISRTTYPLYMSLIGTIHGPGNGTSTVNVLNAMSRFPVGAGVNYAAGDTGGEAEHLLAFDEMPSHVHPQQVTDQAFAAGGVSISVPTESTSFFNNPHQSASFMQAVPSGTLPHENRPPWIGLVPIVRVA